MSWKSSESSASAKQKRYFRRTRRAALWMTGVCVFIAAISGDLGPHGHGFAQLAFVTAIVFLTWGVDAHLRINRHADDLAPQEQ